MSTRSVKKHRNGSVEKFCRDIMRVDDKDKDYYHQAFWRFIHMRALLGTKA